MPVYHKGLHNYHIRKRIHQKHEPYPHPDKLKRIYDKFIYVVVVLGPIINLPQLFRIWIGKDASGVSAFSWIGFSIISVSWFVYGFLHKDKHIMIMNLALVFIQVFIAIGALIY